MEGTSESSCSTIVMPSRSASRGLRPSCGQQRPAVGRDGAGDDLPEGRLAGAVLPDQAVDLSSAQGEIHTRQRRDAAEPLLDGANLDGGHGVGHQPGHSGFHPSTVSLVM